MKKFCLWTAALSLWLFPSPLHAGTADTVILNRVVEAVHSYSHFGMFDDVNIAMDHEIVTLTGHVTQPIKKSEIARVVARIEGVRGIVNALEVLPISRQDDQLRLRVARAIYSHPSFWQYASRPQPPIHIIVEHGHVTLIGRVGSALERSLAFALAQVPGVFDVTNELKTDS
jgi:osmotically-inducible protein OsmY